ncbi:MAG: CPBP family intramembrane glutamic endopeptidase [Nitrososphaerota archaeon]
MAALTINTLFALGEEIGWRGYLQVELEERGLGAVRAALVVGLVWGLWHASGIILLGHNYPENRLLGAALFIAFTASLSLPHADVRRRSSSVLPAASLHGTINAVWGLTILVTTLQRELGGLGPAGIAAWAVTSAITHIALLRAKPQQAEPSTS